jgi:hypothetical protein
MSVKIVSMREDSPLVGSDHSADSDQSNKWTSCCFHVEKSMCRFLVCVLVSVVVLLHCVVELYKDGSCDQKSFYGPIILLIVGIWTPTPKNKKI